MLFFFCDKMVTSLVFFFFQAEDGIRDLIVTGVQTCALPICAARGGLLPPPARRQRRACLHLLHSTASPQSAPTRPAGYRSGHTYAAAFFRNSFSIFSSRVSRSSSRSRARSFTASGGSSPACSRR